MTSNEFVKNNLKYPEQIATRLRIHVANMLAPSGQSCVQQGLGSAVAEAPADTSVGLPFKRVGVQDRYCEVGTTPYHLQKNGVDASAIIEACQDVLRRKT